MMNGQANIYVSPAAISSIFDQSTVLFADVAFGDLSGLHSSMQYTAPSAPESAKDFAPAMVLPHRRYLIASITKPIVGMLAVQMAAEGRLSLSDPAGDFVEGFHRGPFRNITIRHLLTHTSGLPDMLPNNSELRACHATLDDFVAQTKRITPEFAPGADCRYSSMGFAVLASILAKLDGRPVAEQLRHRFFEPIGMTESWLGLPTAAIDELLPTTLPCQLPVWQATDTSHWNWNSPYWRTLGAPWGGMISTVQDLGILATSMLQTMADPTTARVYSPAVVRECMANQTQHFASLSERDRLIRPWSYGWRFNWKDHPASFGDFVSPSAIGHWGATGTLIWIDPASQRWLVVLTSQPWEQSQAAIQRISNIVVAGAS